jgi:hypothetical protein
MSTGPKTKCWTCGEPHYQRDCLIEKARVVGSTRHSTVGDLGKAHRIHVAVNNRQAEHQSTVLETSGMIVNQNFSILIDPCATERFIYSVVIKRIKVEAVK